MNPHNDCPACESGDCLEHQASGGSPTPGHSGGAEPAGGARVSTPPDAVTREELQQFRKKVAKSVKRLNRAVKEARREHREPEAGVESPPEPPKPPERRMSDAAKLGLGVFRSCKRRK